MQLFSPLNHSEPRAKSPYYGLPRAHPASNLVPTGLAADLHCANEHDVRQLLAFDVTNLDGLFD